ncbi:MAG TPA: hypothetical protein VGH80_02175 [Xanthomonadaceae bacterium]|jgi:hypothetical protein
MRKFLPAVIAVTVLSSVSYAGEEITKDLPSGTLQKGSLANAQLIQDTMMGVVSKAATLGCRKFDSYKPYVVALPEGTPGSRVWREKWIVLCQGQEYPIDIRFNESGMGAADYQISSGASRPAAGARIDGSTDETTTSSLQAIRHGLSNRENCLLSSALMRIQIADQRKRAQESGNKDAVAGPIGPRITGMTYEQIIAYSETFPASITALCRN